jgi:HK97 gp10 family phage protein
VQIKIDGFADLDRALGELPQSVRRPVLLRALRKAAQPVVDQATATARRGRDPRKRGSKKQRTSGGSAWIGHGADSIKARPLRPISTNAAAVAVGPDAQHWYMKFLEFGTARQSPQRFLTPAFDAHKEDVLEQIGIELWNSIAAAAARLNRKAVAGTLTTVEREALSA